MSCEIVKRGRSFRGRLLRVIEESCQGRADGLPVTIYNNRNESARAMLLSRMQSGSELYNQSTLYILRSVSTVSP